jgi:hypothetical protein
VRHVIADHPVLHPFLEERIEVLADDRAHFLDGGPPVGRQFGEVLLNGGGRAFHERLDPTCKGW